jgi:hypothetical protein
MATLVHCTDLQFFTCCQPQSTTHLRTLEIPIPSILGNSWNLNSCITGGLIHSKTYTAKTGIPRKSPHYRIGVPLFTFDEDLHDDE